MTASDKIPERLNPLKDIYTSVVFLTRLPAPDWPTAVNRKLATCMWSFPIVGVLIGTLGGITYAVCEYLGLPIYVAGIFAVAAIILMTGGLHEDGLADFADGIWGGINKNKRLTIMTDSRIGTYGAIALIISVCGRAFSIGTILEPLLVLGALVASSALSRAVIPVIMAFDIPAKTTGLAVDAGKPDPIIWFSAIIIGVFIHLIAAPGGWFVSLVAAALGTAICGWYICRRVGGYTGDTLGAVQQVTELLVLALISGAIQPSG